MDGVTGRVPEVPATRGRRWSDPLTSPGHFLLRGGLNSRTLGLKRSPQAPGKPRIKMNLGRSADATITRESVGEWRATVPPAQQDVAVFKVLRDSLRVAEEVWERSFDDSHTLSCGTPPQRSEQNRLPTCNPWEPAKSTLYLEVAPPPAEATSSPAQPDSTTGSSVPHRLA